MESLVDSKFWSGKKVFITGHTGFKGSWMSLWLLKAGAKVTGYSLGLPTTPSMFEELQIQPEMKSIIADIRDAEKLKTVMFEANPDIVIHMAAQPLVRLSYQEPIMTYMTNVMGTVNFFEAARACPNVKAVVNVTSDKCYENRERLAGYTEDDAMGGYDPYSSSKGCAELVTSAYRSSFFKKQNVPVASGRAGNVIGGGDWALDRLIPDAIRTTLAKQTLFIRNPKATRPWQHVLEPVGGYLLLAKKLFESGESFSEGFNFGPSSDDHLAVEQVLQKMNRLWGNKIKYQVESTTQKLHEAHLLSLNCKKAEKLLGWRPRWDVDKALQKTIEWVDSREAQKNIREVTLSQINEFESI